MVVLADAVHPNANADGKNNDRDFKQQFTQFVPKRVLLIGHDFKRLFSMIGDFEFGHVKYPFLLMMFYFWRRDCMGYLFVLNPYVKKFH